MMDRATGRATAVIATQGTSASIRTQDRDLFLSKKKIWWVFSIKWGAVGRLTLYHGREGLASMVVQCVQIR